MGQGTVRRLGSGPAQHVGQGVNHVVEVEVDLGAEVPEDTVHVDDEGRIAVVQLAGHHPDSGLSRMGDRSDDREPANTDTGAKRGSTRRAGFCLMHCPAQLGERRR